MLGRLESKYDETLLDYYVAFIAMCKRVAGLELSEEEGKKSSLRLHLLVCSKLLENVDIPDF